MVLLKYVGMNPVVVHGGGPEITAYMERLDLPVEFVDGLRVSDPATVEVAKMVLVGKVNKDIVLRLGRHGQPAVGLCGDDGLLFRAARQAAPSGQDIGFVGRIERVDVDVLLARRPGLHPGGGQRRRRPRGQLLQHQRRRGRRRRGPRARRLQDHVPDRRGRLAARPAGPGQRRLGGRAPTRSRRRCGSVAGGMRPKLAACLDAIHGGVSFAHIVDGRVPHSLLLELFTDAGQGTKIGAERMSGATSRWPSCKQLEREYAIPTYVRNPVQFVRGSRAAGCGTPTATSTSTSWPGSRCSTSATATRAWWRRSASRWGG